MQITDWIIIGGGAAGLTAAITLARSGQTVRILERNDRLGKKLLATGNGRCNLTTRTVTPAHFACDYPPFVKAALEGYGTKAVEDFFRTLGLELVEGKEGQLFPLSLQASTVVETLLHHLERLGVAVESGTTVESVARSKAHFHVATDRGGFAAARLLLATGSPAAPQLGGNMGGLEIARELGHTVILPHPVLVQLESDAPWLRRAAGVRRQARVRLLCEGESPTVREGDLLFTAYGVSGPVILDLSLTASRLLTHYRHPLIEIDLFPDHTKEQLTRLLLRRIDPDLDRPLPLWLHAFIPKKLIRVILEQARCTTQSEAALSRKQIGKLVHALRHLRIPITATHGFKHAEAAAGGVDFREVDPRTLESKQLPGLHFAGEILDIVGERGGYNLHWAWVSGMRAANSTI
jgi:predicted Rossmann fold flavoprotein